MNTSSLPALQRAVAVAGNAAALARAAGISHAAVSRLLAGKWRPSAATCIKIERATGGIVTREELRPDIFVRTK